MADGQARANDAARRNLITGGFSRNSYAIVIVVTSSSMRDIACNERQIACGTRVGGVLSETSIVPADRLGFSEVLDCLMACDLVSLFDLSGNILSDG